MMPSEGETKNNTRYHIRVLDRAIRILSLLSDGTPRNIAEVSEEIGLSSSTVFRILTTLAFHNLVKRDGRTGRYRLGLACLEMARAYQDSNDLRRVALPELEMLRDEVRETVHLSIMENMEVFYLEKLSGLHAIGIMSSRVGGHAPAHCTGVGKVLLAFQDPVLVRVYFEEHGLRRYTDTTITDIDQLMKELENIRQRGYSFDRGEHEHEVRCVAAPIFDISGDIVAALSISGPNARLDPLEGNVEMINKAIQTAQRISRQLGYAPNKY